MITYNADGVKMPKIKKRATTSWIKAVAASYGKTVGDIGYMFVNDENILAVNNQYLGHDYYTDIISKAQNTTTNCIVSSYMASFTYVA